MISPGSFLKFDWHASGEGKEMVESIFTKNKPRLKTFGLLERPMLASHVDEVRYKLFLVGKSGVGKTSTVAKLSGNDIPKTHCDTAGMQTTTCYWPGKVTDPNKVVLFRLQLCDSGELALRKFDHLMPACTDKADALLFLFSVTDKSSFEELHQQISRLSTTNDNRVKISIATKCDQHAHSEVTQRDIKDFEKNWKIPVLKIKNIPDTSQSDTSDTIYIMNTICEYLWHRDLVLAGKIAAPPSKPNIQSSQQYTPSDGFV